MKSETFLNYVKDLRELTRWNDKQISERLGVTPAYFSQLKNGRDPGEKTLKKLILVVNEALTSTPRDRNQQESNVKTVPMDDLRSVPVVSWIAAGKRFHYEEFMRFIEERIASTSRDPDAFGLIVEGDSMMPDFQPGDRVVVEPSMPPRSGEPVVALLKSGLQVLKVLRWLDPQKRFQLFSKNELYPPTEHSVEEVEYLWPVREMTRKVRL